VLGVAVTKRLFWRAPVLISEAEGDPELYTGTIQLAPSPASRCRRIGFDNRSGELQDLGTVLCGVALEDEEIAAARPRNLDLVREGFRNR
jgi:hypothetical protein